MIFSLISPNLSFAVSPEVYYGGFAFSGKFADIDQNFKYSHQLNSDKQHLGLLEVKFREFFKSYSGGLKNFDLKFAKAEQSNANSQTLVMAIALTREDFFTESLSDCTKVVLNLSLRVVFLDFSAKTIVNSFPLSLEIVDVVRQPVDEAYKLNLVRTAYFGSGAGNASAISTLAENLPTYKITSANIRNLQVRNIMIDEKASAALFGRSAQVLAERYKDHLAQKLSDELSRGAKVSVLPTGRDALNGRCSLIFADGKDQDFTIPPASYAVDVALQDLQTKDLDANAIEKAVAFGAFLNVRVYEPEFDSEFFQKKVIHGSARKFTVTTKDYDQRGIFREVVEQALKKTVTEMTNDKKLRKEVISKCTVY